MGTRELLPGQGPFRFLIMAASAHTSGGTSRWLRAALWLEGSWSMAGAGPSEGPERGGQEGGGSASLHLSSHPLLHCYLMGQQEGGKAGNHRGCRRSHFLPHPRKGEGPTASPQAAVGAGQAGSQLYSGGWISPPCSPATHATLTQHSVRGRGERLKSIVGKQEGRVVTQEGSGSGNEHQGLRRNSVLLP